MATVYHAFGSWVAASDADSLAPGDVRQDADSNGRRQFFTVRNVGQNYIDGYGIGYSFVNE
jgi:hypothetical protein